MKSVVLSLVVAAVVSLGAVSASADVARTPGVSVLLVSAQDATNRANQHATNAAQHRTAARLARESAGHCLRIAADDEKHGFPYQAGLMRAKAAEYMKSAQASDALARQEEVAEAQWRAKAAQQMAQYQKSLGSSPAPHKPPSHPSRG